jgi:hypothetical protein
LLVSILVFCFVRKSLKCLLLYVQIKDKKSDLALLETVDSGKPLGEADADMVISISLLLLWSECLKAEDAPYLSQFLNMFY